MQSRRMALWAVVVVMGINAARAEGPELKLPLSEYEKLRDASAVPAVTVVDRMSISGGFDRSGFTVTLAGRSSGKRSTVPVLTGGTGLRLYDCQGEGILSRGGAGFELTPLAPKFSVRCRMADAGSDRLELSTSANVLWVDVAVTDGEPVTTDTEGGGRQVTVVRSRATTSNAAVKPSVVGRYLLTLAPDETRFRYQFEVRNPNRARAKFDVTLQPGTLVQQVDAKVSYDTVGGTYQFDLPPGEHAITMTGTQSDASFVPPVEASVQYLLLEAHPLLRPTVDGTPRRISPAETGLTAEFRGAQAFLLTAKEPVVWTVTRLEAMHATTFAVPQARHSFFINRDGEVVGESRVQLDNQGASDIALPMKAQPMFASLDGSPVLLTKNGAGDLWTPISQGKQDLVVQYREGLRRRLGFAWGQLWLPQLAAPTSDAQIEVKYPQEWTPLYQRFQSDARMPALSATATLLLVLTASWTWMVLRAIGLSRGRAGWLTAMATIGSFATNWLTFLVLGANLAVTLLRFGTVQAGAAVAALGLIGGGMLTTVIFGSDTRVLFSGSSAALAGDSAVNPRALQTFGKGAAEYKGLPAHVAVPNGALQTRFAAEMLATDAPQATTVVLIRSQILEFARVLVTLVVALALLSQRQRLMEGLRSLQLARQTQVEAAPA